MWLKNYDKEERKTFYIDMNSIKEFHSYDDEPDDDHPFCIKFFFKSQEDDWTKLTYSTREERDKVLTLLENNIGEVWDIDKAVSI